MLAPYRISPAEVVPLKKDDFTRIMNRLLRIEARRSDVPVDNVATSENSDVADGGIDARIEGARSELGWLPEGLSVWQFKSGKSFRMAKLKDECQKPGVIQAVAAGGYYCLLVAQDLVDLQRSKFEEALVKELRNIVPEPRYRLLTASDIAEWCSENPVMLWEFSLGPRVGGLWPLGECLEKQTRHRFSYQPDDARRALAERLTSALLSGNGPTVLQLRGRRGIGKTRAALEAFRAHGEEVLYADDASKVDDAFFQWVALADSDDVRVIAVLDECDPARAEQLVNRAEMASGRLRLLLVGTQASPGTGDELYVLDPLEIDEMLKVIHSVSHVLTEEQARWIAHVSKGYVKLATLLAASVADSKTTIRELTSVDEIRRVLDALLPDEHVRKAMRALSLLERVGWEGDLAVEGQALAAYMAIPWGEMQDAIKRAEREGLVSPQGRYRYVTPDILALWLAADVWGARKKELSELLDHLPSLDSRQAMVNRMGNLSGEPEVANIVQEVLGPEGPFASIEDLDNESNARFLHAMARGHPQPVLNTLERLLGGAPISRLKVFTRGRREVMWTLERLVWRRPTFVGATRLIRRLAEAENETWGNNATNTWAQLFLTYVAPTEVPAQERYPLIAEALSAPKPETRKLAVAALGRVLSLHEAGPVIGSEDSGYAPPRAWHPADDEEGRACRLMALNLLDQALSDQEEEIRRAAHEVLLNSARGLVVIGVTDDLAARLETLRPGDGDERRKIWEVVRSVMRYEAPYLTDVQRNRLELLAKELLGDSFHDRLRRYVGRWSGDDRLENNDGGGLEARAAALADDAMGEPAELRSELPWLTSGEAEHVWFFGVRLGELDLSHGWLGELLASAIDRDARLLSGYLEGRAKSGEKAWKEGLLDEWAQDPSLASLTFEATWRGAADERSLERLLKLVGLGGLPPHVLGFLAWGSWPQALTPLDLKKTVSHLLSEESGVATEVGLNLLIRWKETNQQSLPPDILPAIWDFLERPTKGEGSAMLSLWWQEAGRIVLPMNPVRLARRVLRGVADDEFSFADERMELLREAFTLAPARVWRAVGSPLLRDRLLALKVQSWFVDSRVLDGIEPEILLDWARRPPRRRLVVVAQLVKPREVLSPLVRKLLIEHGSDSPAASALAANFHSGSWMGSFAMYEAGLLGVAKGWLNDPDASVRAWARAIAEHLERRLPEIRLLEEEGRL